MGKEEHDLIEGTSTNTIEQNMKYPGLKLILAESTNKLPHLLQIVSRSGFYRYIDFATHLHMQYASMSRYIVKSMYLKKIKQLTIWTRGSRLIPLDVIVLGLQITTFILTHEA